MIRLVLKLTTVLETHSLDEPQWKSEQMEEIPSTDHLPQPPTPEEDLYEEDYIPREDEPLVEQTEEQVIDTNEQTQGDIQHEQVEEEQGN